MHAAERAAASVAVDETMLDLVRRVLESNELLGLYRLTVGIANEDDSACQTLTRWFGTPHPSPKEREERGLAPLPLPASPLPPQPPIGQPFQEA